MTDEDIKKNVVDALDFEPGFDAANIGVAVDRGVVTLTGHVATYAQKMLVDDAVRRVKGVRGLAEELEVRFFGDKPNSDEDIAKRAITMIDWNTLVPVGAVQVKVQKGWVTLTGKLEWQFQRSEAEEAVKRLGGVTGVTNSIELTPHISVMDIKERIEGALKRHAAIEADAIRVKILANGKIGLEGTVHGWSERAAVERAAWSAPGVRAVEDNLLVA